MIIDIDGLKAVNDSLGHHAGDNLIRRIAAILRERVRTTDIVARLSGDEFAVLMPQTDTEGALQLGEDLRAQVAESAAADARRRGRRRSASGSRCSAASADVGAEAVLVAADQAMYRAKEEGRNRIALFQDPDEPQRRRGARQTTTARIREALTHDRLSLAHPADPQPRLGWDRALRAAAADDRRQRRAAARRLLHRGPPSAPGWSRSSTAGSSSRRSSCWPSASAPASRSRCTSTSPAPRSTDISVLEFIERRLDEGDADPARCTFEITETAPGRATTRRRPASPTA